MKAFRITLIVVDHDGMSAESVAELLCDNRYVFAQAAGTEALEIGEWHDQHPLNIEGTGAGAWFEAETARQDWAENTHGPSAVPGLRVDGVGILSEMTDPCT